MARSANSRSQNSARSQFAEPNLLRSQFAEPICGANLLRRRSLFTRGPGPNWLRIRLQNFSPDLAPQVGSGSGSATILAPQIGSTNWLRELAPQIGWLRKSAPVLANNGGSYCCLRPGQPILSPAKPSRSEASFRMNKKGPHATTQGCQPAKPPEACFLTGMQLTTASTLANQPATLRSLGDPRLACSLERG